MRKIAAGVITAVAFTAFAGTAHAATLKVTPRITGAGVIVTTDDDVVCDQSANRVGGAIADCPASRFLGAAGHTVTLQAQPRSGWQFRAWTGCDDSSANQCTLRADESGETAKTPMALFVDSTPPRVTLGALPQRVAGAEVAATFRVDDPEALVTCRLDYGRQIVAPCSSGQRFTLADGPHVLSVDAVDRSQNRSRPQITFTIDATPPKLTFTAQPAERTNARSATFAFTVDEDATTQCSLDKGAFKPCDSTFTASNLADGTHVARVKADDGLWQSVADTVWTVDTTVPSISFEAIRGPLSTTSVKFGWTVSEPSTFACSLDGAALEACRPGLVVDNLADGPHKLVVTASDGVNTSKPLEQRFDVVTHPIGTAVSIIEGAA